MSRFNVFDATVYKKILVKMVKKIKKGNKKRKNEKKLATFLQRVSSL